MERSAGRYAGTAAVVALNAERWFRKCVELFRSPAPPDINGQKVCPPSAFSAPAFRRPFHNSRSVRRIATMQRDERLIGIGRLVEQRRHEHNLLGAESGDGGAKTDQAHRQLFRQFVPERLVPAVPAAHTIFPYRRVARTTSPVPRGPSPAARATGAVAPGIDLLTLENIRQTDGQNNHSEFELEPAPCCIGNSVVRSSGAARSRLEPFYSDDFQGAAVTEF